MAIVNHSVVTKQHIGIQRAYFVLSGTDDTTIEVPLTGPKQIRKVVITAGANNAGAVGTLTLQVLDTTGGHVICAAKDIKVAAGTYVTWTGAEIAAVSPNYAKLSTSIDGLAFKVVNAGGADAWSFVAEVLFSPRTNTFGDVYVDESVEGVQ